MMYKMKVKTYNWFFMGTHWGDQIVKRDLNFLACGGFPLSAAAERGHIFDLAGNNFH